MDKLTLILGSLAGLVQIVGYWQYNRAVSREGNKPSAASWLMWGLGGATELVVFAALVDDVAKEILPAVCGLAALIIFFRLWWRGNVVNLAREEWITIALDAMVLIFYVTTRDEIASNVFLGADLMLSFRPTIKTVRRHPECEHPTAWYIWTSAYALLTLVIILDRQSNWEFIYPVTCLVLHGLVAIMARRGRVALPVSVS